MHSWSPECAQWCAIRLRRFLFCDMSLLQNYKGPSRRHRVVQSLFTPIVAMGINSFMLDNLLMPFIRNLFERERDHWKRGVIRSWLPECAQWCSIRLRCFLFCDTSLFQNCKRHLNHHHVAHPCGRGNSTTSDA